MKISVCAFAAGHADQLANLVLSLRRSIRPPTELVVAALPNARRDLPPASFPVRHVLAGDGEVSLARGLNRAAAHACGDLLVFLDAGCIADPSLLDDYAAAAHQGGVLMGEIGYLSRRAVAEADCVDRVGAAALRPSAWSGQPANGPPSVRDFRRFGPLNFAVPARELARLGGFDESEGLASSMGSEIGGILAATRLPITRLRGATAHRECRPPPLLPLHHLDSVLADAALAGAQDKGQASEHWLRAFALMGLVEHTKHGWRKLREPDAQDLAFSDQLGEQPGASSALLIEMLERRADEKRPTPLRPAA